MRRRALAQAAACALLGIVLLLASCAGQRTAGEAPRMVGTRNLEQAHARCVERGIPCSDLQLVPWGDGQGIRAFFAEVGGIVFEVMRVEAT